MAPRDRFIGWSAAAKDQNLPLIVNNSRFLILPWVPIPNLGSCLLSQLRRQLPEDWQRQYQVVPRLMETFVETPRFPGTVYQAAGWIQVGTTKGRGRYDTQNKYELPKKEIWLRPLRKDWKRILNRE